MQVLASQFYFLGNRNAGLADPSLLWPAKCIKIGGHVALMSGLLFIYFTVFRSQCGQHVLKARDGLEALS